MLQGLQLSLQNGASQVLAPGSPLYGALTPCSVLSVLFPCMAQCIQPETLLARCVALLERLSKHSYTSCFCLFHWS